MSYDPLVLILKRIGEQLGERCFDTGTGADCILYQDDTLGILMTIDPVTATLQTLEVGWPFLDEPSAYRPTPRGYITRWPVFRWNAPDSESVRRSKGLFLHADVQPRLYYMEGHLFHHIKALAKRLTADDAETLVKVEEWSIGEDDMEGFVIDTTVYPWLKIYFPDMPEETLRMYSRQRPPIKPVPPSKPSREHEELRLARYQCRLGDRVCLKVDLSVVKSRRLLKAGTPGQILRVHTEGYRVSFEGRGQPVTRLTDEEVELASQS